MGVRGAGIRAYAQAGAAEVSGYQELKRKALEHVATTARYVVDLKNILKSQGASEETLKRFNQEIGKPTVELYNQTTQAIIRDDFLEARNIAFKLLQLYQKAYNFATREVGEAVIRDKVETAQQLWETGTQIYGVYQTGKKWAPWILGGLALAGIGFYMYANYKGRSAALKAGKAAGVLPDELPDEAIV